MSERDRNIIIEAMRPRLEKIIKNLGKCFELEKKEATDSYACYIKSFMDFVDGVKKESEKIDEK